MKKGISRGILAVALGMLLTMPAVAARTLIPVGQAVGLELDARGLTVVQAQEDGPLRPGDVIIRAGGVEVSQVEQLREQVAGAGQSLELTVLRQDRELTVVAPLRQQEGQRLLGIQVREGITGIGTVTWYDPDTGAFGALGHGVTGPGGNLLPLETGAALEAQVVDVEKGKVGTPGQLKGAFETQKVLGSLEKNTSRGVFGTSSRGWSGTPLPLAEPEDIHPGPAVILSDLAGGESREYGIEIVKVFPGRQESGRNLLLEVTDPALLEQTGGIVQGMSGSPIIQDGKLVGAVTHVLVNDPETGYGIFIENMLDAAA